MGAKLYIFMAIIFCVALLMDIVGHAVLHIKRTKKQWLLTAGVMLASAISLICCFFIAYPRNNMYNENLYEGYVYLQKGDLSASEEKLDLCAAGLNQSQMLSLLISYEKQDYLGVYFNSSKILERKYVPKWLQEGAKALLEKSKKELNFPEEEYESIDISLGDMIERYVKKLKISRREKEKCDQLWKLETSDERTIEELVTILNQFDYDEETLKSVIRYAVKIEEINQAEEWAWKLASKYPSAQNDIIYTDIITTNALNQDDETLMQDSEARDILEQAKKKEEEAVLLEDGNEKKEQLLAEADKLHKDAQYIKIQKAQNYLQSKKPILPDSDGLYKVQEAKLYLAMEERPEAKKIIYQVIENENMVGEDSPIKEALTDIVDAYNQSNIDHPSPLLKTASNKLVSAESQDIIPLNENTINGKMADYVTSTLKYSKVGIHIGKIDTSAYPEITAYCNINGEYNNATELVSNLEKEDFELIDTQYKISNFGIEISGEKNKTNIALVIDKSGSMEGTPIENAKVAAEACVNNLSSVNQEISLTTYDDGSYTIEQLTDDKYALINSLNEIQAGGGTNISDGILNGISSLDSAEGGKALILLTDGQDGNSAEAMEAAVKQANQDNISIFVVGLGDVNQEYLESIAESTGGKFIMADSSVELQDIYLNFQKYIINNYKFHYKVTENAEVDPRNLTIAVEKYQVSNNKDYTIAGGIAENNENIINIKKGDKNTLSIASVNPEAVSTSTVENGLELTITGTGFQEGMVVSIGNIPLENLKVTDDKTCVGSLQGNLEAGIYQIRATLQNGICSLKQSAFYVFRPGRVQSVVIGNEVVTADQIGQISDNEFVANGNVMLNSFIHSSESMVIRADELPEDFQFNGNEQKLYLGLSGEISGSGKIYISYDAYKNKSMTEKDFTALVFGNQDLIISKDKAFALSISGDGGALEMPDTEVDYSLDIPFLSKLSFASFNVYSDKVQIMVNAADITRIKDMIGKSSGGSNTESVEKDVISKAKEKTEDEESGKTQKWNLGPTCKFENATVSLTKDEVKIGLGVKLDTSDIVRIGNFGLGSLTFKIDTADINKKYWSIKANVDCQKVIPFLGSTEGALGGFTASFESYLWFPNTIGIDLQLADRIQPNIANILYLNSVGLRVEDMFKTFAFYNNGFSTEQKEELFGAGYENMQSQNLTFKGTIKADANLFKSLGVNFDEKTIKWGEWGNADLTLKLMLPEISMDAKASLNIFQQNVANAELKVNPSELKLSADMGLDFQLLDLHLKGQTKVGIGSDTNHIGMNAALSGEVKSNALHIDMNGKEEVDIGYYYGENRIVLSVTQNKNKNSFWVDFDGNIWNGDLFGTETVTIN